MSEKKRLDYHKLGSDLVWISIEQYMASPQISSPECLKNETIIQEVGTWRFCQSSLDTDVVGLEVSFRVRAWVWSEVKVIG